METNYYHENNKIQPKKQFKKKCRACPDLIFENLNEYLLHLQSQHDGRTDNYHMCSDCGKQLKTKSELNHHINSKCGTIKQYKCKECGQELMTPGSLHNHMLRHTGIRKFMCNFCAKLFLTAGQLKVHERKHTYDKAFVCEICGKGFCHRQSLITHSTLHTGIKPFQCDNCGSSFSCVGNLLKHRKTHADTCGLVPLTTHRVINPSTKLKIKINTPANSRLKSTIERKKPPDETETKKIVYDNSKNANNANILIVKLEEWTDKNSVSDTSKRNDNSISPSSNTTSVSINSVNATKLINESCVSKIECATKENVLQTKKRARKSETFTCKLCNKQYTSSKSLLKHESKQHGAPLQVATKECETKNMFKCSCCKAPFQSKDDCIIHQHNEHADKLTCFECDKIFANPDSLRSHQNTMHKGQRRKVYSYVCDKCGKQFKQRAQLKQHEEDNCGTGPQFQCQICMKHFASVHSRRSHMRVHNPEKKLLCKYCGKSFHWKGQLKIHERRHTGEKPFNCLYCPKTFAYRESLITHSSLHTGIKPHLCEACGSRFSCIGNLLKHRVTHASTCGVWYEKNKNS